MIDTGQKFSLAPSALMTDLEVEDTDLEFKCKVFIKVFKTSLNPNLITDLIHLWYDDTY